MSALSSVSMPDEDGRSVGALTSKDGTQIAFEVTGAGPPVIVVPGAMSLAHDYSLLAATLGQAHQVFTIERRGRGFSGLQGANYSISKECEDLAELQSISKAKLLFGHSYGGLIALEYALLDRDVTKVAVYEPGVSIDDSIPIHWLPEFREQLAQGKALDAFATMSIGGGPRQTRRMPRWLMKIALRNMFKAQDLTRMLGLLPTTRAEHEEVGRLNNSFGRYSTLTADLLVMQGGRSGFSYVPKATRALVETVPSAATSDFPRLDHFGPDKSGPVDVAVEVARFFLG